MLSVALLATFALVPRTACGQAVTSEQVKEAIQRGLAYLRQTQQEDGQWQGGGHRGGVTALCLLAMLNAGVPADDPTVARGIGVLRDVPDQATYVVSLKCQVLAAAGKKEFTRDLQWAADWLVRAQTASGMWTYTDTNGRATTGDNSNTQFALLGLHEAAKAGVRVPAETWDRSRKYFLNTQNPDGGWGYNAHGPSYDSMTSAGLANLYITGLRLQVGGPKVFRNGAYPDCGKYVQNAAIVAGTQWVAKNFTLRGRWGNYALYALERVGMISGQRNFGEHDWYRQGAAMLVATQRNGAWGDLIQTPFALLFLAKGNRPVLIQKVQWDGAWNRNLHDLENLTAFIGPKLGKPVTWETTSLLRPLAELRRSPLLLITGHEFPKFTAEEKKRLLEYARSGGTILAEACCGSKEFRQGFGALAAELFPEYTLRRLTADHPVFRAHYRIGRTYDLEGIDAGCRTSVFFSPNALSCLWELQTIPSWSQRAFELGTNIAAYAAGGQGLPDKLDVVKVERPLEFEQPVEVPRGAVRIARLIHAGGYNSDPRAMTNLAGLLRGAAKVDVVSESRHLRVTEEALYEYPVVYLQGHYAFEFSAEEIAALRNYLRRGGFLFADACCGEQVFDDSFRRMVAQLFPDCPLEKLPADHPIFTGRIGVPLGELRYRQALAEELKSRGAGTPVLEAVRLDGREAIVYSKYDFSCAMEGDNPFSCRGYVDADGQKLAMNIVLYGISY